jgi:hypothetical protein
MFLDWLHPMTFSQLSFYKTASFFQFIVWSISAFFQFIVWTISSLIHWINPLSTLNQFWSLMGQLMWMVPEMLMWDSLSIIVMMIYHKMSEEIPFLKKKEKLAEAIFGALFLFYFQLPLLIESWSNIGDWCLIILIVANTGVAYYAKQNPEFNFFICLFTLPLLYLSLIGLWFIPMICFQIAFFGLIVHLDENVLKTNYLLN